MLFRASVLACLDLSKEIPVFKLQDFSYIAKYNFVHVSGIRFSVKIVQGDMGYKAVSNFL